MSELTHVNSTGEAQMVDVTDKQFTFREARAQARVRMKAETLSLLMEGKHSKGDVLSVARIAGILAAKKTADLIPLCHSLALSSIEVNIRVSDQQHSVVVESTCKLAGQTGVEMEALTAATVAALTIYDMCKAVDRGMVISDVRLLEKKGGRSGHWHMGVGNNG